MIQSFIIGFISSLLATIIGAILLVFLSNKFRWFVTGILAKLSHHDIEFVFRSKEDTKQDLAKQLEKTKKIYILTSRGNELKRDPFKKIINDLPPNRKIDFRIILPKLKSNEEFDFIKQREEEIKEFDKAYGNGRLEEEIESNITHLYHIAMNDPNSRLKLRLSSFPHFGRILITDDFLFFQPYNKNRHGEYDPVMKFTRGDTYKAFTRYFDLLWNSVPDDIG